MEQRLQSHYESLSRAIRFTRMADTKAGAALALQFVLLGALAAQSDELLAIITEGCGSFWGVAFIVAATWYGLATLAAVGLTVWVYVPSTPKTGKSLIYFADIAAMDCSNFIAAAQEMDDAEIERQLLDQIYRVSRIANAKMQRVRLAFVASGFSIILGIILLAWGRLGSG